MNVRHLRTLAIGLALTAVTALTPAAAQAWWYYGDPYPPYPYPYPYAYPYPYGPYPYAPPPPPAVPAAPPASAAAQPQFLYRCDSPQGYYPHVASCPGGWHEEQALAGSSSARAPRTPVTVTPLPPR